MNSIERLGRLKGCATFRDFTWPSNLHSFSRYNLVYGWNGTGKTTLSKVLRCLELRQEPDCEEVVLKTTGGTTMQKSTFATADDIAVRVFNREFVAENVFPDSGLVPPVFVLGERSIQEQEELESSETRLAESRRLVTVTRRALDQASKMVEDHEKDQAKAIKDVLQPAGVDPFRYYNQSNYRLAATALAQAVDRADRGLAEERKDEIRALITQHPLDKLSSLAPWSDSPVDHLETVKALLATSVVATVLEVLHDEPKLADWLEEGLQLHPVTDRQECKFCGGPLPAARVIELEGHFNDAVSLLKDQIREQTETLDTAKGSVKRDTPDRARLYPNLQKRYDASVKDLISTSEQLVQVYGALVAALRQKEANPFEPLQLPELPNFPDLTGVSKVNTVISDHNSQTDDLKKTKEAACRDWENDVVLASLASYKSKLREKKDRIAEVDTLTKEIEGLRGRVSELKASLRHHRPPADELNKDLKDYLGHGEIQLQAHDTGYQIMRGSKPAIHLSEGERTAIALLYFLKTLKDSSFNLEGGVVVLDDPVSSLDENSMFSAYGFIQRRTCDAGQVIILTHNFSFFRLVKAWFTKLKKDDRKFYMIECREELTGRTSSICPLDPLLEKYESEYHFLFSLILSASRPAAGVSLQAHYQMPNIARRVLEAFLMFRYPSSKQDLHYLLNQVVFDEPKKARILRFCHTHSHLRMIVEPDHDPHILAETPAVMQDILDLIKECDHVHFDGLVALCPAADGS